MSDHEAPLEEFPTPRDRAFGDIVVDMGLASRQAVEKALGLQVQFAFSGKEVPPLPQLLVGQGLVTVAQVKRALSKLREAAGDRPQLAPDSAFTNTSKTLPAMDDVGSLEDGPRIIMPASALKQPPEPEAGKTGGSALKASAALPSVPRIEHQQEPMPDTGTVEIVMPVGGGRDAAVQKPGKPETASAPDPEPPHPVPATSTSPSEPISGYKLLARLSTDDTGTIFRAKQVAMDRLVALKVLPPKMTADRAFVDRFLKEARDAGQLNHPNLVRVHEIGHIGNYYFYSMELVQGQTVTQSIKQGGRMPPARALQVTLEVVKAIEHMDSRNLLHGEISPDAVRLTDEGAVKVLLAGLGRSRSDNTRFLVNERYHYVAPERAISDQFDVRADLYSAGALLYYSLTGQHPYTGANANQVLDQHFSAAVPNPKDVITDLAADVARVCTKAMCKNRTERFGDPREMIAAIEKGLAVLKPRGTRRTRLGTRTTRHTTSTSTKAVRLKRRRRRRRR